VGGVVREIPGRAQAAQAFVLAMDRPLHGSAAERGPFTPAAAVR
jgi:hypothetical protein